MSDFPERLKIKITDRWFGYDHFAVSHPFFSDYGLSTDQMKYGDEVEYIRADLDRKYQLETLIKGHMEAMRPLLDEWSKMNEEPTTKEAET